MEDGADERARQVYLQQEAIMRQVQQDRQGGYQQQEPPPYVAPSGPPSYGQPGGISMQGSLLSPEMSQLVLGLSQPAILQMGPQAPPSQPSQPQAFASSQQAMPIQPQQYQQQPQQYQQQQQLQQQQQQQQFPSSVPMGLNPQPAAPSVVPVEARPLVMGLNVEDAKGAALPCEAPPEYKLQGGVGCSQACSQNQHFRSLLLSIVMWYLVVTFVMCSQSCGPSGCPSPAMDGVCWLSPGGPVGGQVAGWIVLVIFAVLYIVECCRASSIKYLSNIEPIPSAQYIDEMRRQEPALQLSVRCWHDEQRVRSNRDGKNELYNVRVDTHTASVLYPVSRWRDGSEAVPSTADYCLLKAKFIKTFTFESMEAKNRYNEFKAQFKEKNNKDVHCEFSEELTMANFQPHKLCLIDPKAKPCYVSAPLYWLFSLLLLTLPYRLRFDSMTGRLTYTFVKVIG